MAPVTDFATNPRYAQDQGNEPISNGSAVKAQGHKIVINQSKREPFTIHSGLRGVHRRLRNAWTVETNQDEITDGMFEGVRLFIIPYPRAKFNVSEVVIIRRDVCSRKRGAQLKTPQNKDYSLLFSYPPSWTTGRKSAMTNILRQLVVFQSTVNSFAFTGSVIP
ncbi:unnamed protein product [Heligmosomoides polygyrus]|uniref:IFT52 GIFT domain-containing protein n=1 Tax=Heligmosomoides polygyrus TaxID=6339 RepID=A0A183F312_HELPZ|nr:unnamed protein product [Heligmosomoides polygyrus]